MSIKSVKKTICALLVVLTLAACLTACSSEETVTPPDPTTCTYDEMVEYLTAKGYIAEGTSPVDMLTTEGYVTDNTGGSFPTAPFADRAEDYDGLWLMWWDSETPSEAYTSCYTSMAMNNGAIVYMGGAAVIQSAAWNGNFAIAFAEDYAQADAVTEDFSALGNE